MASGKSTVGRRLAARAAMDFFDTDSWIEERVGSSVAEIFRLRGEEVFRRWERRAAFELAGRSNTVGATGGGIGLDPRNLEILARTGCLIRLRASIGEIRRRLGPRKDGRPLLVGSKPLAELFHERRGLYRGWGWTVDTEGRSPDEVATEILTRRAGALSRGRGGAR